MTPALRLIALTLALAAAPLRVEGKVFLTQSEALELAFPGCDVERTTVYLTDAQRSEAARIAGLPIESRLVYRYVASCRGAPAGAAYFDTHRVRTLAETVMVVVEPDGRVGRVEVLSFLEPEDYIPRGAWYAQFEDRPLDSDLKLNRAIRNVTGATLTARATTDAARRVLALDGVIARELVP